MQIYKNPFKVAADSVEKETTTATISDKVQSLFRHRPHSERHRHTNKAAVLLGYLCNLLSGLTSGTVVGWLLFKSFAPIGFYFALTASLLLSATFIILLETIKRHSAKETLINAIQYRTFSPMLAGVLIVVSSVSVLSSWYGAKLLPELTYTPPTLANIDSIRTGFDTQIAAATVLHTYKPTKTLTKQGAAIIAGMQAEKLQAIDRATQSNDNSLETHTGNLKADSNLFAGIALFVEGLFILCFWFSMSYYWQCYLETVGSQQQPQTEPTPNGVQYTAQPPIEPHQAPTGHRIGFINYENRINENRFDAENKDGTRICKNCNEWYTHKHHKQKYCCDKCRIAYWEKEKGRKLSF